LGLPKSSWLDKRMRPANPETDSCGPKKQN
jgi:hypothetical protein